MGTTVDLQKEVLLTCTTPGNLGLILQLNKWLNVSRYRVGQLVAEVHKLSNCQLHVEGCDVQGGAFTTHASFTQAFTGACVISLNRNVPYGAAERLSNLMRWRIEATGDWTACFKVTAVLK